MKVKCENCDRGIEVPSRYKSDITCSCGVKYWVNPETLEYGRIVSPVPDIISFFRPGEPSIETCVTELLAASQKQREANFEVRLWERKLRQALGACP